ncbi:enoyl-CoA hydratase/isomerase family protein [Saccharopolyspora tripterygii]
MLNAVNRAMTLAIDEQLAAWETDDSVRSVIITGAGERGLCAGGDIVAIHRDMLRGDGIRARYWREEYALNARIAAFPKPYVAVMDGIVMGGGVGLSAHGNVRIVTENSRIGMPEVCIGFIPDVGGTHLLARAPGELGTHLALTASAMTGADAIACGLADYFVAASDLAEFCATVRAGALDTAIRTFSQPPPSAPLLAEREWIDAAYAADTVEEILHRLRASTASAAGDAARAIQTHSPTALKVALRSLRRAREAGTLAAALANEYRVSVACLSSPDFAEGVQARFIDKNRSPRWRPAALEEVSDEQVEQFFAAVPDIS